MREPLQAVKHVFSKAGLATLAQLTLGCGENPCQLNIAFKCKGFQLLGGRTEQWPEEALRLETRYR